jgi:hypothetical protein
MQCFDEGYHCRAARKSGADQQQHSCHAQTCFSFPTDDFSGVLFMQTAIPFNSTTAGFLQRQWHTLQTIISMLGAALLLLLQGGWQHPWQASITAMHWLEGACWSGAVMCMWLSIGYAAYPFVLAALFGIYWLVYHAALAARICCCHGSWDAEASAAFSAAAMWLPKLPDADQKVGKADTGVCC